MNPPEQPEGGDVETAVDEELERDVEDLMAQEAACRTALELADQLPPPSLDDFLS